MSKYLLVDGFNMAFRAYYAVRELTRTDGFPTNALYGWVRSMWKLVDDQKPDETIVFFDLGGAQAKLALLPEYKANRGETPEEFEKQVPIIKALQLQSVQRTKFPSARQPFSRSWAAACGAPPSPTKGRSAR